MTLSKHVVCVDESGDHGLVSTDYPVLVLAFCVFEKADISRARQRFSEMKFAHFGTDTLVCHEREIRKRQGPFGFGGDKLRYQAFMADLTELIDSTKFTLIAVVIDKRALDHHERSYRLATRYGIERVARLLQDRGDRGAVDVLFEARGKKEDQELRAFFSSVCVGDNALKAQLTMSATFIKKATVHPGLEIADLVARPVGQRVLYPAQRNRAFKVIERKLRRGPGGKIDGWGLKVFPK